MQIILDTQYSKPKLYTTDPSISNLHGDRPYRGKTCVNYILQQIKDCVEYGEHNLLIYPNLRVLTEIYSQYFKSRLDANKEILSFCLCIKTLTVLGII